MAIDNDRPVQWPVVPKRSLVEFVLGSTGQICPSNLPIRGAHGNLRVVVALIFGQKLEHTFAARRNLRFIPVYY